MKSSLQYDPETGILHCDGCQQPLNVKKYKPGRKVMCPKCQKVLLVPEPPEESAPAAPEPRAKEEKRKKKPREKDVAEPVYDPEKKVLTCPGCQSQYRVAGYTPGRQIMCVSCERLLTVPASVARATRSEVPPPPAPSKKVELPEAEAEESAPAPAKEPEKERREKTSRREKTERKSKTERKERREKTGRREREERKPEPEEKPEDSKKTRTTTRRSRKEEAAMAPPVPPGSKRILTCSKCESTYNVTSIDVGRKILCLRCETILKVSADLPIVDETEALGLDIIDLGGDGPAPTGKNELSDAKRAFEQFYRKEETRAIQREKALGDAAPTTRRHRTERTIRVSAADLRDMVDQDPNYRARPGIEEILATNAAIRARRTTDMERRRNPVFLLLAIGVPTVLALAGIGFLVHRSNLEAERRRREAALAAQQEEQQKPATGSDFLAPGQTVVFYGLVPGDADIHVERPIGTVLVNRERVRVWAVDESPERRLAAVFKELHDRRKEFGGRVCVKVTARVRPVPEGMILPPETDTSFYLSLQQAEVLMFEDWQKTPKHVEVLGEGDGDGDGGKKEGE